MDQKSESDSVGFHDYYRVLRDNEPYRLSFISYCIDNTGNWLTFVACVSITDKIGGASYTSVYLIIRLLPSFLWASVAGPLADRLDKRDTMIICTVGSACAVTLLMLPMDKMYMIGAIYVTTFIQFTLGALYEPSRNSCIPLFMPTKDLIVSTTLDGLGWSIIGALGSAMGGAINSWLGTQAAFGIDAISYCVCAYLIYLIPAKLCQLPGAGAPRSGPGADGYGGAEEGSFAQALELLAQNPFLICVCLSKASGAAVWGAADLLTVKQSQMARYQTLGDESVTLGLIFAMVGVGCYFGPITWNALIRQDEQSLVFATVVSFALLAVSYLIMMAPGPVYVVMLATVVRCLGSATIWIYSNLLIQLLVEPKIRGRVFAIERALYVLCEIGSIIFGGVAFDVLQIGVFETCAIMAGVGAVVLLSWASLYISRYGYTGVHIYFIRSDTAGRYKPVSTEEESDTA
jgi:Na+/melibiose symporter-like transporter